MLWADALTGLLPSPRIDASACTRTHASGCDACVAACPRTALAVTPDAVPVADPLLCVSCGLCEAACPTRAISGVAASPELIVSAATTGVRLRCEVARRRGATLGDDTGRPGLDVGCAATLHPETVAAAAADGPVDLVVADCSGCALGEGGGAARVAADASAIALAEVNVVHGEAGATVEATRRATRQLSRRSLFRRAATVQEPSQVRASTSTEVTPRSLLLERVGHPLLPLPVIDESCTGCEACVRTCPADALAASSDDDGVVLLLEAQRCIGCGDCVRLCPESAIELTPGVALASPSTLIEVASRACATCSRPLGAGETDRCTSCATRASLAADAVGHLFG